MPFVHLFIALTSALLGFVYPILHSHQNIPTTPQVLASTTKKTLGEHIAITPTLTTTLSEEISLTPTLTPKNGITPVSVIIDCIGPDGKHLRLSQKACDNFNAAWHNGIYTPSGSQSNSSNPYGQATKVGDHTYELKVVPDDRMATAQEVFTALNLYRQKNAVGTLIWSTPLANYAQNRSNLFASRGSLDDHAGFIDYINNQDGFSKLGFNHLGENAAEAGPLLGEHIIEWIFASDAEHNANQLNSEWTHVGIGVSGISIDVVFGASPR